MYRTGNYQLIKQHLKLEKILTFSCTFSYKYGECFSIYIFGRVMTIVAKDSLREVFRKHQDFSNGITEVIKTNNTTYKIN